MEAKTERIGFLVYFRLRVRIWGLLGQGIGDLDSGLTMNWVGTLSSVPCQLLVLLDHVDNIFVLQWPRITKVQEFPAVVV